MAIDALHVQPHSSPRAVSCAAGFVVLSLGAAVLIGWVADIEALKSAIPGQAPMRPNAAAGFVMAGASLCMLTAAHLNQPSQWMMRATAALTLLLGILSLSETIFGWNLGIDELLIRAPSDSFEMVTPGRMSSAAAASFVLLGSALLLLDRRSYAAAQILALVTVAISLTVLGGYLFGLMMFPSPGFAPPTAAHAALGFLLMSSGVLASSMASGLLRKVHAQLPAIGLVGTVILLSLAGAASYVDTQRMADSASNVDETHAVLARLNNVSLGIERFVTTARVFVLAGDEVFLAPLDQVERQITVDLTVLRQTFAGDPGQLASLGSLEELVERQLALSNEYINVRRRLGVQQALDEISPGGEQLATEIRTLIADMEQTERFRLEQLRTLATASNASTLTSMTITGSVSLILILLAFATLRKQMTERVALESEIIAASEHERIRIGQDLHDGLGQELTGISLGLEALARSLEAKQSADVQTARSLRVLTQSSISTTRRIARSLSPGFSSKLGICETLNSLVTEVNEHSGLSCVAQCPTDDEILDIEVAAQLFRIAQESINNALKHGNAKNIKLRCGREGDTFYLEILDDGVGIPEEHSRVEGLGLRSMRYRARMIDGTLSVTARDEGGTEVRCILKVPRRAIDRAVHENSCAPN